MAQELPLDLGDESQVKSRNKTLKARERERDEALLGLMQSRPGRDWVWEFLSQCHIFHTPFSENPNVMAFKAGEQNVGQRLIQTITRIAPEQYMLMLKEKQNVDN